MSDSLIVAGLLFWVLCAAFAAAWLVFAGINRWLLSRRHRKMAREVRR